MDTSELELKMSLLPTFRRIAAATSLGDSFHVPVAIVLAPAATLDAPFGVAAVFSGGSRHRPLDCAKARRRRDVLFRQWHRPFCRHQRVGNLTRDRASVEREHVSPRDFERDECELCSQNQRPGCIS
jgi:hypothetical protein